MNAMCSYASWTTVNSCTEQRLNRRQCKSAECKVNRRQCKSVLRRIEGREFAGVVHTLQWVGELVHCGPQWVGEGWLIWICHRAAIERFEPHRCTRQSRTVLRTTRSNTSIEKTITMDSNGFFNVHCSRASGQSTETLVDCVNEGAGYNNSLRQRRTLLTSASQASGSIQSTRRKLCFKIKMN